MSANYAAPGQPSQPAAQDPGRTLGIVGLILAIVASVIGLIISIVALRKSKAAGYKNGVALAGVIIGILTTIGTAITVALIVYGASVGIKVAQQCQGQPGKQVQVNGQTVTCPANS